MLRSVSVAVLGVRPLSRYLFCRNSPVPMRTLAFGVLLVLSGCNAERDAGLAPGDAGLSERIAERTREGDGAIIDLAALAPFRWSRLHVFPPYTPKSEAERALGFSWPYRWTTSIEHDEVAAFLVFVNERDVVAAFDHSRATGDLAGLDRVSFSLDSARFVVRRRGDLAGGKPHYALVLAR